MAILRIIEFPGIGASEVTSVQAAACPPVTEQPGLAIGASSVTSLAFNNATTLIRVSTDVICAVFVGGKAPVATVGKSARMVAGQTEYFRVQPGDLLAVIADT